MLKGDAKKQYQKDYMKRQRSNITDGSNTISKEAVKLVRERSNIELYPDILDKLTNPVWRSKLEKICHAFQSSHRPDYTEMCWLGDNNLTTVCDWLECTR